MSSCLVKACLCASKAPTTSTSVLIVVVVVEQKQDTQCRLEEYELLPQLVLPLHVLVLPVQHKQSQAVSSSLKAVLHNQHTHIGTEFLSGQRSHVAGHTFGKFR